MTMDEIDKQINELDIILAIENRDVPYVVANIRGLINENSIVILKRLERSIENMYKDASYGEYCGTVEQQGLEKALGLIKSELKKYENKKI